MQIVGLKTYILQQCNDFPGLQQMTVSQETEVSCMANLHQTKESKHGGAS